MEAIEQLEVQKPLAFVSCSLRKEDQQFVDFICNVLIDFGVQPFGTVGKYSAYPENPIETMKRNITASDFVVIVATPRYKQEDVKSGVISNGVSEMIHFETGIAINAGKPVVVFVQHGTNVGNVLPNITQYITLDGTWENLNENLNLIHSLLYHANEVAQNTKRKNTLSKIGQVAAWSIAAVATIKYLGKNE